MNDETRLRLRATVRKIGSQLRLADSLLETLHRARDGSRLVKITAFASVVGQMIDWSMGSMTIDDTLQGMGYEPVRTRIGPFLYDLLAEHPSRCKVSSLDEYESLAIWPELGVAMVVRDGKYLGGPYVKDRDAFERAVRAVAWAKGADLELSCDGRKGGLEYHLEPMKEPGKYAGSPSVDSIVKRITAHGGSRSRNMLLMGPTGVGKTTIARLVARKLADGSSLTLKLPAGTVMYAPQRDLLDMVRFLGPSILLLDDMQGMMEEHDDSGPMMHGPPSRRGGARSHEDFLSIMEALHGERCTMIGTYMTHGRWRSSESAGALHVRGIRPGRFDEIVPITLPDKRSRRSILRLYLDPGIDLPDDLLNKTQGLSGAYLMDLAYRINVHGLGVWKRELKTLRMMAPRPPTMRYRSRARTHMAPAVVRREAERVANRIVTEALERITSKDPIIGAVLADRMAKQQTAPETEGGAT